MPFMIVNVRTGLYSGGGNSPRFVEFGKAKIWKTLGQLKGHLAMFRTYQGANEVPADWDVVQVELKEVGQRQNARQLVQPYADEQARRQGAYRDAYAKQQVDREKAELKRLKEKYE